MIENNEIEQVIAQLDEAEQACLSEDETLARVYVREQSTRHALRSAVMAMRKAEAVLRRLPHPPADGGSP